MYPLSAYIKVVILRNDACQWQGDEGSLRPIGGEALLCDYTHRDSPTRLERRAQNDSFSVLKLR